MNLLDSILSASRAGSGPIQAAAEQAGVSESDARLLFQSLIPALTNGMRQNAAGNGGIESLVRALGSGGHQRYLSEPSALRDVAAVTDGNAILGHLLGSKDSSRTVASEAAQVTGIDVNAIKRFLPLAAATVMGALSRETDGGTQLIQSKAAGLLGRLLKSDSEGSIGGGLLSIGRRLFQSRQA